MVSLCFLLCLVSNSHLFCVDFSPLSHRTLTMLPFLGIVLILTLWGSFFPVPFTGVHPEESLVERITGAIKATFVVTGAYELSVIGSRRAFGDTWYQDPEASPEVITELVVPLPTFSGSQPVENLATEFVEPSHVVFDSMGANFTEPPVLPSRGGAAIAALVVAFILGCWLVFGPSIAYKLEDLSQCVRGPSEPTPKVDNHLTTGVTATLNETSVVVESTSVTYDSVVGITESSKGLGVSGVSPIHSNQGSVSSTDSVPVCVAQCSEEQEAVSASTERVCMASNSDVTPAGEDSPTLSESESPQVLVPEPVRPSQSSALVLYRPENISPCSEPQPVLEHTEEQDDGQAQESDRVEPEQEKAPKRQRKNRPGQKRRQRVQRSELRSKQAELIRQVEEHTSGPGPAAQPTPPPAPAPPAGQFMPTPGAPMAAVGRAGPVPPHAPGRPPFQPPFQQYHQGAGGYMPPYQWQYQQYGQPGYPYRRYY